MHIHFDPLGGLSGDMFAAAMLDAFPQHWAEVERVIQGLDLGRTSVSRLVSHGDGTLTGKRFIVAADAATARDAAAGHRHDAPASQHHHHEHAEGHHGAPRDGHRAWTDIRAVLTRARLDPSVEEHAVGIFRLLARAEAEVHGVSEDAVSFHEVGAVDSIVDVVAAAALIALVGPATWSSAPLPLGSGRVNTQHGPLPIPAPATALLLRGLLTIDDGIAGERVTPTGAAIARYLLLREEAAPPRRRLLGTGTGFGSRVLPGISNCLRVVVFAAQSAPVPGGRGVEAETFTHRELGVIAFEVDDQSAEDLSNGLDRIRALPGIHDVVQSTVFGKKGRMAAQVQVLAAPDALEAAISACFTETTTIGLRFHMVQGAALRRVATEVEIDDRRLRVKLVQRPDGTVTAKTEASDVAGDAAHSARAALRREAEAVALSREARQFGPRQPGERP